MTSKPKYRIVPGDFEGEWDVEKRLWPWGWGWVETYPTIEGADRAVQQLVRDDLWRLASPPTYYDSHGRRVKNSS